MRNKLQIVSFQNNFILDILGHKAVDSRAHVDASDKELAQKVSDFNQRTLVDLLVGEGILSGEGNLDGKVSVSGDGETNIIVNVLIQKTLKRKNLRESHLVTVSLGDANHHVVDQRANGVDTSLLLGVDKPHFE